MTFDEAKYYLIENKPIIGFKKHNEALGVAIIALGEVQAYRAIGTIEEFKALKEKNEPKKPIKHDSYYVCPCCGNTEIEYCNEVDCRTIRLKRCTLCEQKLDWSE